MVLDPVKNFAISRVATAPSPADSGTTLVVETGDGALFPDPATSGAYNVVIYPNGEQPTSTNAEIVRVTARTSDTMTITREQESSTARTIVEGDIVMLAITAKMVNDLSTNLLDWFYPVGTIYETTSTDLDTITKMGTHFGGTWEVYGAGAVTVAKSADTEFDTIGETGGTKTHTLQTTEIPSHTHTVTQNYTRYASTGNNVPTVSNSIHLSSVGSAFDNTDRVVTTSGTGSGNAHNNLQPYIVVFRYRRTA